MLLGLIKHRIRKQLGTVPLQTTETDSVANSQATTEDRSAGSESVSSLETPKSEKNDDDLRYEARKTLHNSLETTEKYGLLDEKVEVGISDNGNIVRRRNVSTRSDADAAGSCDSLEPKADENGTKNNAGLKVKIAKQLDALGRSGNLLLDSNECDKEVPVSESADSILSHRKQTILE